MIFETRRIVEPRFLRFSAVKTLFAVVFENLVAFIAEKAYTSTYCAHFVRNAVITSPLYSGVKMNFVWEGKFCRESLMKQGLKTRQSSEQEGFGSVAYHSSGF
jgi:hypothetical protein